MIKKELQKRIISSIIIIPLSFFFIIKGSFLFIFFLTLLFLISASEWVNMSKNIELKIFGIFFLFISFYSTFFLREKDLFFFLLILIICISTDLGGYIFGKLLKGPKLIKISPNKTYSGMIGSFLLAIIFSYLFINKYEQFFTSYINDLKDFFIILFILLISFVSQIGDLIISYFKRLAKVKDTGSIIPGHGGLLDRVDGIIFAIPISYLLIIYLK